jgi:hypothetical protein
MFVPSIESLSNKLGLDRSLLDGDGGVKIPATLFKFLLQIALAAAEFDEESYLKENPDVANAVARGDVESAHMHFIGFGYFEGRQGSGPEVDEKWYLQRYPDVAQGVRSSQIKSAAQHFFRIGAAEGRIPNPQQEDGAAQWKKALRL